MQALEPTGRIHSLESFGSADGPGVRYIVFLEGCPFRCRYCHNPDTWAKPAESKQMTPSEVLKKAMRFRPYWGDNGGITVSGGEPLLQMDWLIEFFRLCKENGINTCIDTAAGPFTRDEPWFAKFRQLMDLTDLILLDIKQIDDAKHRDLTGRGNASVLDCARFLSEIGKPVWLRHVLVPGITTGRENLEPLAEFLKTLTNIKRVDVLPYHTLGVFKWEALGIPYSLSGVAAPTQEQISEARELLSVAARP